MTIFLQNVSKTNFCQQFCKSDRKVSSMETGEHSKYFQEQKRCVWIQPSDID